jgi:hypothetical protein
VGSNACTGSTPVWGTFQFKFFEIAKVAIPIAIGMVEYEHFEVVLRICPGGEIGRRTTLRWWRPKGCAGSNPVLGTFISLVSIDLQGFFIYCVSFFCRFFSVSTTFSDTKKTHSMTHRFTGFKPAHNQHALFDKLIFRDTHDTHDTQQCQSFRHCIQTDTPSVLRRTNSSSHFFSVFFTCKRCNQIHVTRLAELICMACSLKPLPLTSKSNTL